MGEVVSSKLTCSYWYFFLNFGWAMEAIDTIKGRKRIKQRMQEMG
jgi:hypothetical protein